MEEEVYTPAVAAVPLRSGSLGRLRRLLYWLRSVVLWQDGPTAAAYSELIKDYRAATEERLRLQVEVAVARAERDAAREQVTTLSLVVERDRERVRAEMASASADRERAVNSAQDARRVRREE